MKLLYFSLPPELLYCVVCIYHEFDEAHEKVAEYCDRKSESDAVFLFIMVIVVAYAYQSQKVHHDKGFIHERVYRVYFRDERFSMQGNHLAKN